ncbi:MAG: carbohydrate ABC transporter permease [Mycetocola sp.]
MTARSRISMEQRRRVLSVIQLAPAVVWALFVAIPIAYLVLVSLRTRQEYSANPLGLPTNPAWENYATAWVEGGLLQSFLNNIIVTVVSVAGTVLLASMASYAIARWRGRIGNGFYLLFVLGLIVPFQLGLPTLYRIWVQAGLVDSLWGVILIHIAAGLPFAIFLYSGFLLTVPLELEESARVDGAGDVRTFVSVVFPLLRPVTATVVILTSIGVWNDLLIALYFLQSPDKSTLSRSTLAFVSDYSSNIPVVFACAVLIVAPILVLFVLLQRFFISGLTQGALRG